MQTKIPTVIQATQSAIQNLANMHASLLGKISQGGMAVPPTMHLIISIC